MTIDHLSCALFGTLVLLARASTVVTNVGGDANIGRHGFADLSPLNFKLSQF